MKLKTGKMLIKKMDSLAIEVMCRRVILNEKNFMGLNVYMPVNTDGWLRALYSDSYMTPIKNWTPEEKKTRRVKTTERLYRKYYE